MAFSILFIKEFSKFQKKFAEIPEKNRHFSLFITRGLFSGFTSAQQGGLSWLFQSIAP